MHRADALSRAPLRGAHTWRSSTALALGTGLLAGYLLSSLVPLVALQSLVHSASTETGALLVGVEPAGMRQQDSQARPTTRRARWLALGCLLAAAALLCLDPHWNAHRSPPSGAGTRSTLHPRRAACAERPNSRCLHQQHTTPTRSRAASWRPLAWSARGRRWRRVQEGRRVTASCRFRC